MDEIDAIKIMSGRRRGAAASAIRAGAWLASKPYSCLMRLRRWLYRRGILPSRSVDVPVISVGNITTGGTGKTPLVGWLVGQLRDAGRRPASLTRGYRAVQGRSDEAEMLFEKTGSPVVIDPDRVAGARKAISDGADVLVMDDGFQHLRLRRDLDIVLIDATRPFGFGHVLPRGMLREPPSALKDADAIILTRCDSAGSAELIALRKRVHDLAPQASLHAAVHEPVKMVDEKGRDLPPESVAGRHAFAFCGIANPDPFYDVLAHLGAKLVGACDMKDHVEYTSALLANIADVARSEGAELLVTTAKDRIKIDPGALPIPLWTLEVVTKITEGRQELMDKILVALRR